MPEQSDPQALDKIAQAYHKNNDARFSDMAEDVIRDYKAGLAQAPDSEKIIADYNRNLGMQEQLEMPAATPPVLRERLEAYPNRTIVQYLINAAKNDVDMLHAYFERQCLIDAISEMEDGIVMDEARRRLDVMNKDIIEAERKREST